MFTILSNSICYWKFKTPRAFSDFNEETNPLFKLSTVRVVFTFERVDPASVNGLRLSSFVFSIQLRRARLIIAGKSGSWEASLINVATGQKCLKLRSHRPCPVSDWRTFRFNYIFMNSRVDEGIVDSKGVPRCGEMLASKSPLCRNIAHCT